MTFVFYNIGGGGGWSMKAMGLEYDGNGAGV